MDTAGDRSRSFGENEALSDPFEQFGRWYDDAAEVMRAPEQMAVATVAAGGQPSVRMVLCKGWDQSGFCFHTNYTSRKGRELVANPFAALLFHWDALGRQVRIEGRTEPMTPDESDAYFSTRPAGAQVGAWASQQSQVVGSRAELEEIVASEAERLAGLEMERPPWWGGIRLRPSYFEFWQNRDDRLHDRIVYELLDGGWDRSRLQP